MNEQRIKKEFGALFPALASVVGLVVGLELLGYRYSAATAGAAMAFLAGCAMIGALSFGTEYDSKTLLCLLSQPVSRRAIWYEKMAALAVAMLLLCLLTGFFAVVVSKPSSPNEYKSLFAVVIVPLCAMGGSPYLSLVCRSTVVGAVVAVVLPIFLLIGTTWALARMHVEWPGESYFWFCHAFLASYALVLYWLGFRKFIRLQLAESRGVRNWLSFQIPMSWQLKFPFTPKMFGGPLARLVRKEFHLQTTSYLSALLFSLVWLGYRSLRHSTGAAASEVPLWLYGFYMPVMAIIIGAVSVASERGMGTMPWQFTLPFSRLKQWLVKLAVIGTTCLLLMVLPVITLSEAGRTPFAEWDAQAFSFYTYLCIWILFVSVFTSSLSNTPVRAIILSVGVIGFLCILAVGIAAKISETGQPEPTATAIVSRAILAKAKAEIDWIPTTQKTFLVGLFYSSVLMSAILGYLNYRQVILRARRTYLQITALFICVALWSVAYRVLDRRLDYDRELVNRYQFSHWDDEKDSVTSPAKK